MAAVMALALGLVLLHAPTGSAIYVNPDTVTTMRSPTAEKNKHFTDEARCVLNTSDGKFISVVESCDEVRELLKKRKEN